MLKQLATTTFILFTLCSSPTHARSSEERLVKPSEGQIARKERKLAIDRCTAVALMLSAAYTTYPDDNQLRTDYINRERELLQERLGTTDLHLAGAAGPMYMYDGKRVGGAIPKTDPIASMNLAAEGAASCMAALYDRDMLYNRDAVYSRGAL